MPNLHMFTGFPRWAYITLAPRQTAAAILYHHMEIWATEERVMALQVFSTYIMEMTSGEISDAGWEAVLDTGLAYALKYVLFDGKFCGFSEEDLAACVSESQEDVGEYKTNVLPYIIFVMLSLRDYLGFSLRYSSNDENDPGLRNKTLQNADVLARELPRFWNLLWQIRTPLLDSLLYGIAVNPHDTPPSRMLQISISVLSEVVGALYKTFPAVFPKPEHGTKMPHVILTIWVHCAHKMDRNMAMENMWTALSEYLPEALGEARFQMFFHEVDVGATNSREIARAAVRDLRARQDVNLVLRRVLVLANVVRPTPLPFYPMAAPHQRRLLHGCIAAGQSFLCMCRKTRKTWSGLTATRRACTSLAAGDVIGILHNPAAPTPASDT
ncbi:hypothetical protein PsYK624_093600 [Phanerochaete sordida]|uniref:Uncharacterized protein n=1 Tax=Phanerochaete sordida TaxID=48140 RepID=A0A9P3GE21_9APHY|nr:hypothetical protein PsYK624_093600 [Phanerochaete sordida]